MSAIDRIAALIRDSRGVAPPPNFVQTNVGSGAYVPAAPMHNRPLSDQRVGAVNFAQPFVLPAPGQLLLPGPVDPSAGQQYITATPLTCWCSSRRGLNRML